MGWSAAARREIDEVLSFLAVREWSCVSFSSRLLGRDLGTNRVFINRSGDAANRIIESLLLTNHGMIIPVLDPDHRGLGSYQNELLPLIRSYAENIHSVMGIDRQVGTVDALIGGRATERLDYFLMTHEYFNITPPPAERGALTIRQAGVSDLATLFPLQRDYEKEEVLLDPERFSATSSFLALQKSLRKEIIYLAEIDDRPVAKAGTNARGINYYQIGGVFTIPPLRGQGIAKALMRSLMWEIAQKQKHICLFVKKANTAAIRLYSSLGFSVRDSFAINYYRI